MQRLLFGLAFAPALSFAQEMVEPISFRGVPASSHHTGFVARVNLHDDLLLGKEQNFVFMQDEHVQINNIFFLFATIPIAITNNELLGDDISFTNVELGGLLRFRPTEKLSLGVGVGVGLPIFEPDEAFRAGFLADDANPGLYIPELVAVRPQLRAAYLSKFVSVQANLGADIGFAVGDNETDQSFLRGELGAALYVTPSFALQSELSFIHDLTSAGFTPIVAHAGLRRMSWVYDKLVQPGIGVFLPVNEDARERLDLGFEMDFRVSL